MTVAEFIPRWVLLFIVQCYFIISQCYVAQECNKLVIHCDNTTVILIETKYSKDHNPSQIKLYAPIVHTNLSVYFQHLINWFSCMLSCLFFFSFKVKTEFL